MPGPSRPAPPRSRLAALGVATVLAALGGPVGLGTAVADQGGGPSASDVAKAKADAQAKADAAGRAQAQVAVARAELGRLRTATARAVAAYQAAEARFVAAQRAAARATLAVEAAGSDVMTQRLAVAQVATASYRSGGVLGMWGSVLSAGGPDAFLERASAIQTVAARGEDALGRLRSALLVQRLAEDKARFALAAVTKTRDAATAAKNTAEHALTAQQQQVGVLVTQETALEQSATSAKSRASSLASQRAAFLERQREERQRQLAALQASSGGVAEENPVAPTYGTPPPASPAQGRTAVAYAKQQIGKPYQWGASGPDTFDCSGLTMRAWAAAGIGIDHYSVAQYGEGEHVSRLDLRPGDLVFFAYDTSDPSTIHHVGIYVGNGMMIEAPHTGANVRYSPAFRSDYIGATRP